MTKINTDNYIKYVKLHIFYILYCYFFISLAALPLLRIKKTSGIMPGSPLIKLCKNRYADNGHNSCNRYGQAAHSAFHFPHLHCLCRPHGMG